MVRRDDLQYEGVCLYQDDALACFSEDAVLLANFLRLSPGDRAVDLGTGNGVIAVLGAAKTGASFVGVDIQREQLALARRSAGENGQQIPFYHMDVRDAPAALGHGSFTAAVMNPPYFHTGDRSANGSRALARHDGEGTLDAFLQAAFLLLKNGGKLFLCYPGGALVDVLCAMRNHRLEPKRLRLAGNRALVEGKKDGGPGLVLERE